MSETALVYSLSDSSLTATCTMCELQFPVFSETPDQIEDGMCLIFSDGYGMFTDNVDEQQQAITCHDCFIKILELFPQKFKDKFKRGHSSGDDNPSGCTGCEYSWNSEEGSEIMK